MKYNNHLKNNTKCNNHLKNRDFQIKEVDRFIFLHFSQTNKHKKKPRIHTKRCYGKVSIFHLIRPKIDTGKRKTSIPISSAVIDPFYRSLERDNITLCFIKGFSINRPFFFYFLKLYL